MTTTQSKEDDHLFSTRLKMLCILEPKSWELSILVEWNQMENQCVLSTANNNYLLFIFSPLPYQEVWRYSWCKLSIFFIMTYATVKPSDI